MSHGKKVENLTVLLVLKVVGLAQLCWVLGFSNGNSV